MYKVIIVEDETMVREGIVGAVDFQALGYILVDDCQNGKQAMESIQKYKPDVVITDICMPIMDGIELAQYIYDNFPQIKTVLLTGYSDFEYARCAIKLQVYEYVLKPISAKLFGELLKKIKAELDQEKTQKTQLNKMEKELYVTQEIVKEHYLNKLITQISDMEKVRKNFSEIGIDFIEDGSFVVMILSVDNKKDVLKKYQMSTEMLSYAVCNICIEICGQMGIVFRNESMKTVIILKDRAFVRKVADEIQKSISINLDFTVSLYVGNSVDKICDVALSYAQALYARHYKQMFKTGSIVFASEIGNNSNILDFHTKKYDTKIIQTVKLGDEKKTSKIISEMINDMKKMLLSYEAINFYTQNMVSNLINMVSEITESEATNLKNTRIIELSEDVSLDMVEEGLYKFVGECVRYLNNQKGGYAKQQIEKAQQYIKQNYGDAYLSLKNICEHLSVSTSYFSLLFKTQTGVTFVEYLTKVRMEKAKQLLKTTDLKAYEISERTGYVDPHYFSVIFKKYTGLSPKEFREKDEIQ